MNKMSVIGLPKDIVDIIREKISVSSITIIENIIGEKNFVGSNIKVLSFDNNKELYTKLYEILMTHINYNETDNNVILKFQVPDCNIDYKYCLNKEEYDNFNIENKLSILLSIVRHSYDVDISSNNISFCAYLPGDCGYTLINIVCVSSYPFNINTDDAFLYINDKKI